jgi:hypothetical protein
VRVSVRKQSEVIKRKQKEGEKRKQKEKLGREEKLPEKRKFSLLNVSRSKRNKKKM